MLLLNHLAMKYFIIIVITCVVFPGLAQDRPLPYSEIPAYPESFTAGSVASRIIDGLGFRFYWATDGLREEDLSFKPNDDARTTRETIEHIYGMSILILNSTLKKANESGQNPEIPFTEMRKQTLENLKHASERLRRSTDQDMKDYKVIFKRGDNITEYPFWNQLNGPIADCIWHVGQIVSFRRSSGNPFNENVSVFSGTVRK